MNLIVSEVYKFKKDLFNLWKNDDDKRFFDLIYQAFRKYGLNYYENEFEEVLVRERFVLSFVLYLEYCNIAGFYELKSRNCPSIELLTEIKNEFNENSDDEMIKVVNGLNLYFGNENNLADNLWLNCIEGSENRIIPYHKISEELEIKRNDYLREQGYNFLCSGKLLNEYLSLSI